MAVLLAAEILRLTLAGMYAELDPARAESFAPRLPEVLLSSAMAEVGAAAAQGQDPPQSALEKLRRLSKMDPLRVQPLLVQAAVEQKNGDGARAEQLLLEARRRDPRSPAARYLLADGWLRSGRIAEGLGEMAILARLLPGSAAQLMPALAQYANAPGAAEQLKRMLVANPQLKHPLLAALAADPGNADLILELDSAIPGFAGKRTPEWQTRLLEGLIRQGAYDRGYATWQRISGIRGPRPLLFNADFRRLNAPPPFNWAFASSGAGLAEPENGSMRVLFYGRDDITLASQLLLLEPGAYRFSVSASGTAVPRSLAWVMTCIPAKTTLLAQPIAAPARMQARFEVPSGGCPAQRLELRGLNQDMPKESDVRFRPLLLERLGQ